MFNLYYSWNITLADLEFYLACPLIIRFFLTTGPFLPPHTLLQLPPSFFPFVPPFTEKKLQKQSILSSSTCTSLILCCKDNSDLPVISLLGSSGFSSHWPSLHLHSKGAFLTDTLSSLPTGPSLSGSPPCSSVILSDFYDSPSPSITMIWWCSSGILVFFFTYTTL